MKQFSLPKYAVVKKTKKKIGPKKMASTIFGGPQASCFYISKKWVFECVFVFFLAKEIRILSTWNQKILDEIKQSNGIKPLKNLTFKDFCMFFLTKQFFVGKCLQKLLIFFTWNIKNIPSVQGSSTLYLQMSLIPSSSFNWDSKYF